MERSIQKRIRRAALVLGFAVWFPAMATAGWSGFFRLDGVSGESQDANHSGWMDVSSVGAGIIGTGTTVTESPFYFEKKLDSASPRLALDCAESKNISSGELDLTDSTDRQFLHLKLNGILISSNQVSGNFENENRPNETVCMTARVVSWNYAEINPSSGLPAGYITNTLDFSRKTGYGGTAIPIFVVTGIHRNNGVELNWPAVAGKRYHIYAVTRLDAPFAFLTDVVAEADGELTREISPVGSAMFYVVEEAR
jgi:type VI secretion system secreted protein Hcp